MLRLFRSISRGRRKGDGHDNNNDTWSPFAASPERSRHRAVGQRLVEDDFDDEDSDFSPHQRPNGGQDYFHGGRDEYEDEPEGEDGEDGEDDEDEVETPLLPIFSAAHLDRLPLYNITHAIRILIIQRCETTLSWDQLRSPQISQFLVKPIQGQIRADHFNRATLCALIANCLQFQKEGQAQPGNIGVSKTRAAISELIAMRLLKEFSTRELIDSLSYDFDPLQGISINGTATPGYTAHHDAHSRRTQGRVARVSTIEIAIRAEAKRFLAHTLVVQHLEAIWAGNIVFHSAADSLHRRQRQSQEELPLRGNNARYGTADQHNASSLPAGAVLSRKGHASKTRKAPPEPSFSRRTVTLYNPREASLFKLSRLRVPRYRQVFSTLSFATMLGLFIAVLVDRSITITPLEVLFWFWSVGYMLDEVVGFTEQGFGLYILSFWNAFDLGILVMFVGYYLLRLYGLAVVDQGKHRIASLAYDVLASTAVLLFPRLFSVLDHYRYFSQLLIAFRMMTQDLLAILVLIIICCSGFFVALSLSFADDQTDAAGVVYSLFQILMGFTPAVWDRWDGYNILGKAIMSIFLTICHFLIVTILITVLTNSFMAIVKNAEEEHQFLFAVNTISMVKSDALFSFIAPTNIFGWILSPLRWILPLRQYVRLNRTIIKATHFPILLIIFSYERMIMARSPYGPEEVVERQHIYQKSPAAFRKAPELYTPTHRLREPSVISFRKDRALDEVFRRPFHGDTVRTTTREMEADTNAVTAVDKWMHRADVEGGASPPIEQPRSILERLEHRRPKFKRASTSNRLKMMRSRDFSTATRSVASDGDMRSLPATKRPYMIAEESEDTVRSMETLPMDTEADGDDETNDESDIHHTHAIGESAVSVTRRTPADESESEYFQTPTDHRSLALQMSHAARARLKQTPDLVRELATPHPTRIPPRKTHNRHTSTGTILFAPAPQVDYDSSVSNPKRMNRVPNAKNASGTASPVRKPVPQARSRSFMPIRQQTAPMRSTFMDNSRRREPSFNARALDLASEIGDNKWGPSGNGLDAGGISGFPASFSEQMMRERDLQRQADDDRRRGEDEEKGMVNRIMLARMNTLEEGFREVLKEIKDMTANNSRRESEAADSGSGLLQTVGPRSKLLRAKVDTTAGMSMPLKTPIGRIGGNDVRTRKSPKKVDKQGGKNRKEAERPRSGGAKTAITTSDSEQQATQTLARQQQVRGETPSPESVTSIVPIPEEGINEAGEGPSRPVTARPNTASWDEDPLDLEEDNKEE